MLSPLDPGAPSSPRGPVGPLLQKKDITKALNPKHKANTEKNTSTGRALGSVVFADEEAPRLRSTFELIKATTIDTVPLIAAAMTTPRFCSIAQSESEMSQCDGWVN
jgi:hypothetical protein